LRRDHPDVKLLIFDHNKDHAVRWANSILNASNPASDFVDGTAVHWYAGGMDRYGEKVTNFVEYSFESNCSLFNDTFSFFLY
jgi:O-glycosyl hydrolase